MSLNNSATAIAQELGERLKQARLNADLSQAEVAKQTGVSRKAVLNAEKGQASLVLFVAIMITLNLTEQLACFLPPPSLSPLQLAKLQGKRRKRASRQAPNQPKEQSEW